MQAHSALKRVALASLVMVGACGDDDNNGQISGEIDRCVQPVDLTSSVPGAAPNTDPALINAWGIAADRGAFAIASNGGGVLALYNADGTPASTAIPNGLPIGQAYTGVARGNNDSLFLVSEGGQISFIDPNVDARVVAVKVDNSASGAVYKGVAVFDNALLVANFSQAQLEVYDTSLNLMSTTQFTDPDVPAGYAPFNVAVIDNAVYVTYALQNDEKDDDVAGAGLGFLAAYNTDGTLLWTLGGAPFNAPWGMALAPPGLGDLEGALLVGNFGDGRVTIVDRGTHVLLGQLLDVNGVSVVTDGLWGLATGDGVSGAHSDSVYFTAGPADETQGLYGVFEPCQ